MCIRDRANIRNDEEVRFEKEKAPVDMLPEYLLHNFPCTLFFQMGEKAWNEIQLTSEIEFSIKSLDELPVYDIHTASLIYIPPKTNFDQEIIFNTKSWSEEFEGLLSRLGSVINMKACAEGCECVETIPKHSAYGILWRDCITQLLFHVNVLMHADDAKMLLEKDKVCVYWNESEVKVPKNLFSSSAKVNIVVTPYLNKYYRIETYKNGIKSVTKEDTNSFVIEGKSLEMYLRKKVIAECFTANIKKANENSKSVYFSNFLQRAGIIKDIKNKSFHCILPVSALKFFAC
eukprot:TRINITY_DN7465_c0_g2_i25.p1 TRINITY_DN7465_c0_g2~~TRINITY_DN7465_c0_g2_i25.p1  ORF type:complete len:289 (+),score=52.19 TRINITY_DN7465_c0_g2_i25:73-939(+)